MRVDPFLSLTRMMKKKRLDWKPTRYMLRKVKLSTYLSTKLMKIEDCFAPELQSKFWEALSKGGC
jgi:hypothetical protein